MRRLPIVAIVLLLLCATGTACKAAGPGESRARELRLHRTLWVFPPAAEFADSERGFRSIEIGLTPGLWTSSHGSDGVLGPRLGVFIYPDGECKGVAFYVGVRPASSEVGLWYVWRAHDTDRSSGNGPPMSFRIGIGAVRSTDPDCTAPGRPGFGAAFGFAF